MEAITGVFKSSNNALETVRQLQDLGIPEKRIGMLTPGMRPERLERSVPMADTEAPGMGKAMGAAVGGAMGVAGGATLGMVAASLAIPGVGPVLALGILGGALLGIGGAAAGAKAGETLEEELGEGLPREDVYLYEDALRHGHSVVIAYADEGEQTDRAIEIFQRSGVEDLAGLRENWWHELRENARTSYAAAGRDFKAEEKSYRCGFQAALHPQFRGMAYSAVETDLKVSYGDPDLDEGFKRGFKDGLAYHESLLEINKA